MAAVLGAFVPDTAVRWHGVVTGDVARRLGVVAEAKALAGRLERAGAAVRDAEARAARGDDGAARWLANVRAAAYEADAAVDRCRVAARRRRLREQHSQSQQQPHHHQHALPRLLSSCCDADVAGGDIAADIRNLNRKLQVILKEKNRLQLRSSLVDHHATPARTALRHRQSQVTPAPHIDVVGTRIDDDAAVLVRQLTEAADGQAGGCAIVAVVGPDGIGKTTLAARVYGSERIRRSFGARSWVRVPREYTEAALLSQVVDAFGGDTTGRESFADLEKALARLVEDRRFLLVLDDVRHGGVWEDVLRRPLLQGAAGGRGSKVLVTARHSSIAREMGAGLLHRVKKLGADDGWLLLRAAARVTDEAVAGELKDAGERIVEKCGGMPLAIKAVAGVLRTREANAQEWEEVLKSPAWMVKGLPEDAMKPLYLCYDDLPCHLKQCFLYCSLFPSDFAIDRRVLVQQWIAEGFVQIRPDASVEDVAEEYYDELIRRHLLQPAEEDGHGGEPRCTMHDMLRALAQLLSLGEDLTGDSYRLVVDSDATFAPRRVSFPRRNLAAIPEKILKLEGLRTLILQKNLLTIEGSIFVRLEHLRVLDLSETAVELIPDSLGNLVYLRFLNLSHTRIQAIPESIANLWSLKFLLLRGCKVMRALPKGIEHLRGLRDLDLAGTVIEDAAFRVGHLRSLTSLRCFAVTSKEARAAQDRSGWPLDELKNLSQLKTLHIQKLEKAAGRSEATEMSLAAKKSLRELELSCSGTVSPLQTPELVRKIEDIFEEMIPPLCLESLKLVNYFGTRLPRWLSVTFLPNLRDLDIIGCNFCQSFPPLGRLPELRSLYIADSSSLKDIGAEFMGTNHPHQVPFPKLENLHLQGLLQLNTWRDIEPGELPSLQVLQLESCPKLQRLPAGLRHVTSLTELRIADMASLEAVDDIATVRELSAWNTPSLKRISDLPALVDINMCHCPVLEIVENVNRLQTVHIFDYDLRDMPRWIEAHAPKIQSLNFTGTIRLLKRCLVDGPDWPVIKDIKEVHGYSTGSNYIYYTRSPYIFESNVSAEENLNIKENSADPGNVDDVSVSSSGMGYLEIRGFFDSKAVKTGAPRTEDKVLNGNMESSMPILTRCRSHKQVEVIPEGAEDEDVADSAVLLTADPTRGEAVVEKGHPALTDVHTNSEDLGSSSKQTAHESREITNDQTQHDTIPRSAFARRRSSKTVNDVPSDDGIDAKTYATKSSASIASNLVREGSRAINITEIDQGPDLSTVQSKEHTREKGLNLSQTYMFESYVSAEDNLGDKENSTDPDSVDDVSVSSSGTSYLEIRGFFDSTGAPMTEDNVLHRNMESSMPILTCHHLHKMLDPIPEDDEDEDEEDDVADSVVLFPTDDTTRGAAVVEKGHPALTDVYNNSEDLGSLSKETTRESRAITNDGTQHDTIDRSILTRRRGSKTINDPSGAGIDANTYATKSAALIGRNLVREGSRAINITEIDQGLNFSVVQSKEHTYKKGEDSTADVNQVENISLFHSKQVTSRKGKDFAEKVSSKPVVGSAKDSSVETANRTVPSVSKLMRTISQAIDVTELPMMEPKAWASRFSSDAVGRHGGTHDDTPCSIDAKEDDDPQEAPKVYTAIWADTDTDTLQARFVDSMRHLRRMASQRRHRRRRHSSKNKWRIRPELVAILLLFSVVQLLFILWLCRRLLNQN